MATIDASTSIDNVATTTAPNSNVGVIANWTYSDGITSAQMSVVNVKISQWLAVGLSLDEYMSDDHVFMCRHLADDSFILQRYVNPSGYAPPQIVSESDNLGGTFTLIRQRVENGIAYFDFTLSNFANSAGRQRRQLDVQQLSQTTAYYPLIAFGQLDSSNAIIKHGSDSRFALPTAVMLNETDSVVHNVIATTDTSTSIDNVATTTAPNSNVGVIVNWTYSDGITSAQMSVVNVKISQWLAVGLSLDEYMSDDHVFMCRHLADDSFILQRYVNPSGYAPPQIVSESDNLGGTFTLTRQRVENGIAYFDFTLSNFTNSAGRRRRQLDVQQLSQTTAYYPLIAFGRLDSS
ncbi:unnamed protein product, partial [Rotaria sp. Silwood2]